MSKGLSKVLEVGRNAFYEGKTIRIIAAVATPKKSYIVQHQPKDSGYVVERSAVEAVVSEVFPLGSKVRSQHSFRGTVTGYEQATNRVIVVSEKIGNYQGEHKDRTRFSYKVKELDLCVPMFEMNKIYYVQTQSMFSVKVRVLEHPAHKDMFALHEADTGAYLTAVGKDTTVDNMHQYGLLS